jgi:phage replication-related protein YjqB (UPF0714/DUF867 family)
MMRLDERAPSTGRLSKILPGLSGMVNISQDRANRQNGAELMDAEEIFPQNHGYRLDLLFREERAGYNNNNNNNNNNNGSNNQLHQSNSNINCN